jgi:hypothetical protein
MQIFPTLKYLPLFRRTAWVFLISLIAVFCLADPHKTQAASVYYSIGT